MPTIRYHNEEPHQEPDADNIEEQRPRPVPEHLPEERPRVPTKAPPPEHLNSNRVCSYEAFCRLQARVSGMEEPRLISRDS